MGSLVSNLYTDYIRRSANVPQYSAATLAGWWKSASGAKASATQFICGFGSATSSGALITTTNTLALRRFSGATSNAVTEPNWSEQTWYYIAVTYAETNHHMYVWNSSGSLVGSTSSADSGAPTWTAVEVANRHDGGLGATGKYAYWKMWDRKLTQPNLEAEMFEPTVIGASDFNSGFADSETDIGPNSRNWTPGSVDTDSDTPPVVIGLTPIVMTWTL